tara:strand:- start:798 stop:1223 length:426 start_codon:yes stop_codon:yes gene_type:complete
MNSEKAFFCLWLFIGLSCFGCITEEDGKLDNNNPVIAIISPAIDQTYVAEWGGAWPEGEPLLLEAKGIDDVKVKSIQVTVSINIGDIVLNKVLENLSDNKLEFTFSESFTAEETGVYTVLFIVIDFSGNVGTSTARTFTYL